ncbi:hypothetical protein MF1_07480 [Bartonella quintana]|uniref:dATP/dGTP diphosphohydrolase domain-containing protein n=1 Tax=Bartonella quintana TaxID=803 RepID=UPI001316B050|nr:hypothetical protein MF1_07480 [Bartonella quintana]
MIFSYRKLQGGAEEASENDAGKAHVDLIPPLALIEIDRILEFGAKKYGANIGVRV